MIAELKIEVRKVKRSWCVCAGVSILEKFKTEEQAQKSLVEDAEMHRYWANSVSVIVQNTKPIIKVIN